MTIRELAERINVSPATVSVVLNGRKGVGEKTRKKVLDAIEQYQYTPGKRSTNKPKNVLVLKFWKGGMVVEENQGFISMVIDAIEETLRGERCRLTMLVAKNELKECLDKIKYDDYYGVIVIATEITEEMYDDLECISVPFVVVDNTVPNYRYNSICMNNSEIVYLALHYCMECGHKEIGYFRSAVVTENFNIRNDAFKVYVKKLGLAFEEKDELQLIPTLMGAYQDLKQILQSNPKLPNCFFADNDTIALGAIKALKEFGYKIPEDISVIGIDDIPFSSISSPTLTTIRVQKEMMGRQAVRQLMQLIKNPEERLQKVLITGELIVRSSVLNQTT